MSIDSLKVYASHIKKQRVGPKGDGGYVIVPSHAYDLLLSGGVSDNIDFECSFLDEHPTISCLAFDGTITNAPRSHPRLSFIRKNIGVSNSNTVTNLHNEIIPFSDIFLKLDIETFEYRWLQTLTTAQLSKFKQIVMEFHFPWSPYPFQHLDIDIPITEKVGVFSKLAETHRLVHFHGNNCCGVTKYLGVTVPNVFECTFIRKDIYTDVGLNADTIPSPLDHKNTSNSEINISWPPFVHIPQPVVIQRWVQTATNYPSSCFWGLGDLLRGTACLYEACSKNGYTYVVDISYHPISKFLSYRCSQQYIDAGSDKVKFYTAGNYSGLVSIIKQNINPNIVLTNGYISSEALSPDCKILMKNILTLKSEIIQYITDTYTIPDSYMLLHCRFGDNTLIANHPYSRVDAIVQEINKYKSNNIVLISDSYNFKQYILSLGYSNVSVLNTSPCHIGCSSDMDKIRDTLVDFYIATRASSIITFSVYSWVSGFMNSIHNIYDIPLVSYTI